jgi:hypothetical protein
MTLYQLLWLALPPEALEGLIRRIIEDILARGADVLEEF